MKKYYSTLDKKKKRQVKEQYQKEYKNTNLDIRLKRLVIYSIIGYAFSIFIFVYAWIREEDLVGTIITSVTLVLASTLFLVGRILIKRNVLNKIALKKK